MHPAVPRGLALVALLAVASPTLAHDDDIRFVPSTLRCTQYDGVSDDLLTAGLGKTGLQGTTPRSPIR